MPSFPSHNPRSVCLVMGNEIRGAAAAAPPSETREARMMTFENALDFMLSVKDTLDRAKYIEFLDTICQKQRIGVRGIADRMKVLLRGYPALLRHFDMFLPVQYKISLTDNDQQEEAPAADSLQGSPAHRG